MSKIGIFYASSTGNTEDVAKLIKEKMSSFEIDLHNVADCVDGEMENYDSIIIGASTWGDGELQDDWDEYIDNLNSINFSKKTVAMYGLGDQEEYCDYFLDAMGIIYDKIVEHGGNVVGSWPTDGYEYDESKAVQNDEFVGLALDEDNQSEMTQERVSAWVEQITPHFSK
ncbi:MAG: flavodoxin [Campylobacterota bacterium]|nr:flavodoxin [Campylobacterota bacterium]